MWGIKGWGDVVRVVGSKMLSSEEKKSEERLYVS
jgi:hypothetical protein